MTPSRAHTSIEFVGVVLFIILFVMPLAQGAHGEPCVHEAVAVTFTRSECQIPELLSRGDRAKMTGGIVPKGRGSVWLTELHTLPRVSLPAATWASAVLPKANRILSCSRLKPLKRGRSRSLAAAGARAPTGARAAGWRGPAGRANTPAGRGHKVSLPQRAAAGRHGRQRHWLRQPVNGSPVWT
jgi:hypothetical protein